MSLLADIFPPHPTGLADLVLFRLLPFSGFGLFANPRENSLTPNIRARQRMRVADLGELPLYGVYMVLFMRAEHRADVEQQVRELGESPFLLGEVVATSAAREDQQARPRVELT